MTTSDHFQVAKHVWKNETGHRLLLCDDHSDEETARRLIGATRDAQTGARRTERVWRQCAVDQAHGAQRCEACVPWDLGTARPFPRSYPLTGAHFDA